jgi:putative ATP-binding cassette transporter
VIFTISPITTILYSLPAFQRSLIATKQIKQLENEIEKITPVSTRSTNELFTSNFVKLEIRNIKYEYLVENLKNAFILGPINLCLKASEIVFIVGHNGSGKSTLVKLISGLYEPQEGEILLNDQKISAEDFSWYRENFSVVFYNFYLFNKLLVEEGKFFDQKISEYSKILKVDKFVKNEERVLLTGNASDGQRRRLAFLNLYLENKSCCIFDEPTSDQDVEFKDTFYKILLPELKQQGKCVLVISHDKNYFSYADRLIYLKEGKIVNDANI